MEALRVPQPLAGESPEWLSNLDALLERQGGWSTALNGIITKLKSNTPLTVEDGLTLYHHPNLSE
ncbi:MAG: hypothetical protein ACO3L7_07815, partial [Poseidonia sp.]